MGFLEFVKLNWAVISNAPWVFISMALVVGGIVYAGSRLLFSREISSLKTHILTLEGRIRYRDEDIASLKAVKKIDGTANTTSSLADDKAPTASEGAGALTREQRGILREALAQRAGTVHLARESMAFEQIDVAEDIRNAFLDAGWSVTRSLYSHNIDMPLPAGLSLIGLPYYGSGPLVSEDEDSALNALRSADIEVVQYEDEELRSDIAPSIAPDVPVFLLNQAF